MHQICAANDVCFRSLKHIIELREQDAAAGKMAIKVIKEI
jgi:hypothetical protein